MGARTRSGRFARVVLAISLLFSALSPIASASAAPSLPSPAPTLRAAGPGWLGSNFALYAGPTPATNPDLAPACGLRVVMVLDESGSITAAGAITDVRDAAGTFLESLRDTGSEVAVVSFNSLADTDIGFTEVTQSSIDTVFDPYLRNDYFPQGWTNWEAALTEVLALPYAPLVVFFTDGNPNVYAAGYGEAGALAAGITQANAVKTRGSHIFGVGVGDLTLANLISVTGPDAYADGNPGLNSDDYVMLNSFSGLSDALRDVAIELCGGTVTINKSVELLDGSSVPGEGWMFTASLASGGAVEAEPSDARTDASGRLNFSWPGVATETVTIEELVQPGFELSSFSCRNNGSGPHPATPTPSGNGVTVSVSPDHVVICDVVNVEQPVAPLDVTKSASPTSLPEPGGPVTFTTTVTNPAANPFDIIVTGLIDDPLGDVTSLPGTCATIPLPVTLAPGQFFGCTYEAVIGAQPQTHTDTITAVAADPAASGTSPPVTVTITDIPPTLTVLKTAVTPTVPEYGGVATFSVVVTNTSNEPVDLIELTDDQFGDLDGVGTCDLAGVTLTSSGSGSDSYSCEFSVSVEGNAGTIHTDTITARVRDDDGSESTASDSATVTFTDVPPTVTVDKTANTSTVAEPIGDATYTVTVSNTSPEPVILETLADDAFGDLDGQGDCVLPQPLATAGSPGDGYTCTFVGTIAGVGGATHVNEITATVRDDDDSTGSGSDTATVLISDLLPSVMVLKTAPGTVPEPGGDVLFRFEVMNFSDEPVTLTSLDDPFLGGSLDGQGTCSLPQDLGIGASYLCEVTASVTGAAGYVHTNTVTAAVTDTTGNPAADTSTATITIIDVEPEPLAVTKTVVGPDSLVDPGGTFTYEVVVTNPSSNFEAIIVSGVSDDRSGPMGSSTADVSASCDVTGFGGAFPITMQPGDSFTCQFTLDHTGMAGDQFTNIATASGADAQGNPADGQSAPVTVSITAAENPDLGRSCGSRVIFILDESGSIAAEGAILDVKDAADAFIAAFADTGSEIALIEFNGSGRLVVPYTEVTGGPAGTLDSVFRAYLDTGYDPAGVTNWQSPLQIARSLNDGASGVADLVLVFTDGNPNTDASGYVGEAAALASAIPEASAIKGQGSHLFGVGVGGLDLTLSNLIAITGPDPWPATSLLAADYALVNGFGDLADVMTDFATEFCGGTIEVTKFLDTELDGPTAVAGWEFTVDAPVTVLESPVATTDSMGFASFTLETNDDHIVTLTETPQPGFGLVDVTCFSDGSEISTALVDTSITLTVGRDQLITCDFTNAPGAQLIVDKTVDADGDGLYGDSEQAAPGAPVTFRVTITNPSLIAATISDISDAVGGTVRFTADQLVTTQPGLISCADLVGSSISDETVTCSFDAFAPGDDAATETDAITVRGTDDLANDLLATDDATVTTPDAVPDPLVVVKSGDPLVLDEPGGVTSYSVVVSNPNTETVVVSGASDERTAPDGSVSTVDVSALCDVTFPHDLVGGGSFTCSFDLSHSGEGGDQFIDAVTVSAADDEGNDASGTSNEVTVTIEDVVVSPTITKSGDPLVLVEPGGTTVYTVTVENPSFSPDVLVLQSITDTPYGDVTLLDSGLGDSCSLLAVPLDLAPGDDISCTYSVEHTGVPGDTFTDTVMVSGTVDGVAVSDMSGPVTVEIVDDIPDPLVVTKSGDPLVLDEPGGVTSYDVVVSNPNTETVTVSGVSDVRTAPDGTVSSEDVSALCDVTFPHDLVGGGSFTCSFDLSHSGEGGDVFADAVTVSAADDEGNDASGTSNTVEVTIEDVVVSPTITKSGDPLVLVEPGGTTVYTATITNPAASPDALMIDAITDAPFGDVTSLDSGLVDTCAGITYPLIVTPGGSFSCTYSVEHTGVPGDTFTDTVMVSGTVDGVAVSDMSGPVTVEIVDDIPDPLVVTKSGDPLVLDEPGGVTSYDVVVSNPNTETVTVSGVSDVRTAPDGTVSSEDVSALCDVTFPHDLVGGGSFTCSFDLSHSGEGGDVFADAVTVSAADDEGNDASGTSNTVEVTIEDVVVSPTITKDVTPSSALAPSGFFTYSATIENPAASPDPLVITSIVDAPLGNVANLDSGLADSCAALVFPVTLAAGDSLTCTYSFTHTGVAGDTFTNTVSVFGTVDGVVVTAESDPVTVSLTPPGNNPDLPPAVCGIDVIIILDESGSIGAAGAAPDVINATRTFLESISGSTSNVAIVEFNGFARFAVPYTEVTADSIASVFDPYLLGGGYNPSGITNWESAFDLAAAINGSPLYGGPAELVLFFTDGNPNANASGLVGEGPALAAAVAAADVVKGQGSHIFGVGVGAAGLDVGNLIAVTGPDQFPAFPIETADYAIVDDFDQLAPIFGEFANDLCGGTVLVEKLEVDTEGATSPGEGWEFTLDAGAFGVLPAPTALTGPDGTALFTVETDSVALVTLTEVPQAGFALDDLVCSLDDGAPVPITPVPNGASFQLGADDAVTCTFTNGPVPPASIVVTKTPTPGAVSEPGGPVTFAVSVQNDGVGDVVIQEILDSVYGDVADPANPGILGTDCDALIGTTASEAQTVSCSFVAFVAGDAGDVHDNTVTVTGLDPNQVPVQDSGTAEVDVTDVASDPLVVEKSAVPGSRTEPGGVFSYTVVVTNPSSNVDDITVSSLSDTRVEPDGSSATVDVSSGCDLSSLGGTFPVVVGPGGSFTCTFDVSHVGNAGDLFADVVTAFGTDDDGTNATGVSNEVVVDLTDVLPVIGVSKVADPVSVAEPGGDVVFTVRVDNESLVESVTLTALVDSVFGDLNGQGDCSVPQVVAVGGFYECSFSGSVTGNAGDVHSNTVSATAEDDDGNETTETATETVDIIDVPSEPLDVVKSVVPLVLDEPGGLFTYTVVVTNPASNVDDVTVSSVSDFRTDADGSTSTSDVSAFCDLSGFSPAVFPVVLEPGESFTCSFSVTHLGDAGDRFIDVATASGVDDDGADASGSSGQVVAEILDVLPVIGVSKVADPVSVAEPGGDVVFTVRVDNESLVESVTLTALVDSVFGDLNGQGDCSVPQVIAVGGFYECSFTGAVTGDAGDTHSNTVSATVIDNEGNETTETATETVDITDVPSDPVDVLKSVVPLSVDETGGVFSYTVVVTNPASNVDDLTVSGVSDERTEPDGSTSTTNVSSSCDLSGFTPASFPVTLEPGESFTCSFDVTHLGNAGDVFTNVVTAPATDDDGADATGASNEVSVDLTDVPPEIAVSKTAEPAAVAEPGGSVTFTVRVDNLSVVEAVTVTALTDSVFGDLNGEGDCAVPQTIPAGGFYECSFTGFVGGNAGDVHSNTVSATGQDNDGNSVTETATETVDITDVPSIPLELFKIGEPDSLPEPGGTFSYGVSVVNPVANVDAITVTGVTDTRAAPDGMVTTIDISDGCNLSALGGSFPVTLQPGASFLCFFDVEHLGDAGNEFANSVTATGTDDDGADASGTSNEVTVFLTDVESAPLELVKIGEPDSLPEPGGIFSYGVSVTNPADNVDAVTVTTVTDTRTAPDGTVTTVDVSAGCDLSGFTPSAFPVTLEPGEFFLCFFDADHPGIPGDDFDNAVTAAATDDDGSDATGTSNTVTVAITDALPTIAVTKTASPTEITDDGIVTFTIDVQNTSTEPVTITSITDSVFTDIDLRCAALIGAVLQPGQSTSCVFNERFTATSQTTTVHENTVTATATDDEQNVATDQDSATVTIEPVIGSTLDGHVFIDNDTDGIFDPEDSPIASAPATLTGAGSDGELGTADDITADISTDASGGFSVADVEPGTYEVVTSPAAVTAAAAPSLNGGFGASGATLLPTTTGVYLVTVEPDGTVTGLDFGFGLIDLAVAATVDSPTPAEGDTVTVTFTVTNEGTLAATGATAQVTLPAGLTFQLAAVDGSYDPTTGVWSLADVAPGGSAALSLTLIVDAGTAGTPLATQLEIATALQFDVDSTPGNGVAIEDDIAVVEVVSSAVLDTTIATTTTEVLPKTGGDLGALGGASLMLLLGGALLLAAGRRRQDDKV